MKIKVTTRAFEYMGLPRGLITDAEYDIVGNFISTHRVKFKHVGKLWVLEGLDYVIVEDDVECDSDGRQLSALDKQVSGNHYKDCGIQPIEYIHSNGLNYFEGNAVKYITRHRKKNGKADIEKAIHYLELMLELEYKDDAIQETIPD